MMRTMGNKNQRNDIVHKTNIRLYFPPDTACCPHEYDNMPSQDYRVTVDVRSYTRLKEQFHDITIMDIEPANGQKLVFNWNNLTKRQKLKLKRAVYNSTCESLEITPNHSVKPHINKAVADILFEG